MSDDSQNKESQGGYQQRYGVTRPNVYRQTRQGTAQTATAVGAGAYSGLSRLASGKGGAMFWAMNNPVTLMGMYSNPKGRLAQLKVDKQMLGQARNLDLMQGLPTLRKMAHARSMKRSSTALTRHARRALKENPDPSKALAGIGARLDELSRGNSYQRALHHRLAAELPLEGTDLADQAVTPARKALFRQQARNQAPTDFWMQNLFRRQGVAQKASAAREFEVSVNSLVPELTKLSEPDRFECDVYVAEWLVSVSDALGRAAVGAAEVHVPRSTVKASSAGPIKISNPLDSRVRVRTKMSASPSFIDRAKKLLGIDRKPELRQEVTFQYDDPRKPAKRTTRRMSYDVPRGTGFAQKAMILPAAVAVVAGMNAAYRGAKKGEGKLRERRRYRRALDKFLEHGEGPTRVQYERDAEATEPRLQASFQILNEYAPSVARDPVLAAEYMSQLSVNPLNRQSPEKYLRTIKEVVALENQIQAAQPSLFEGLGGVPGRLIP